MSEATDVLRSIDQLRRDLSGYHGQLVAHNDLQRHCDNQRERLAALEGMYANVKSERNAYKRQAERFVVENVKLRNLVKRYHRLVTGTDELWSWQSVYAELQELGIEVDE